MNNEKIIYDLIILGGGCAGLSAGIYSSRSKMKTLIIEKSQIGGQGALTDKIENYPGVMDANGYDLTDTMKNQAQSFGVEFLFTQVTKVMLNKEIKEIITDNGIYEAKSIIIATGAKARKAGFEGEEEFTSKGVGYCATCDGFFYNNKEIFVIGGGYSAAQEALFLTKFGKKVTIIVRKDYLRCDKYLIEQLKDNEKIEIKYNTELLKVHGTNSLEGAFFKNNLTGEIYEYKPQKENENFGVFVFVGFNPITEIFKDEIILDKDGYIITDDNMKTNIKGVFAAGDIRVKSLRQLITAAADGAIAAKQAYDYCENI